MKKLLALLVLIGAAIAAYVAYHRPANHPDADLEGYGVAKVLFGPITEQVSPSGPVEPGDVTVVGTSSTGEVVSIPAEVDFNKSVKQGDVLVELDSRQAKLNVDKAKAAVQRAKTGVESAEAQLEAVEKKVKYNKDLVDKESGPRQLLEQAEAERDAATVKVKEAQDVVKEAKVGLEQAHLALKLTRVLAPFDGVILDRKVTVGQFVGPPAWGLFVIARDLKKLEVHTQVAEGDIGKILPGQNATFTVSAYPDSPDRVFTGKVKEIRDPLDRSQAAVYFDAVLEAENMKDPRTGKWLLRPGMTANATITCRTHPEAWKVQSQAINFEIDAELQTLAAKNKLTTWKQGRKNPDEWQHVWVMGGGKNPGADRKPWPIFVRVGGKNSAGETGIVDNEYTEVLEWDPEVAGAMDPKAPSLLEVITKAPKVHKPSFFERMNFKL